MSSSALDANPDADVLLLTIEKALLPRLLGVLMHVWNPFSKPQTTRALSVVTTLVQLASQSRSSTITQNYTSCLRDGVVARLHEALDMRAHAVVFPSAQAKQSMLADLQSPTEVLTTWLSLFEA